MFWEAFLMIQLLSPTGEVEFHVVERVSSITKCRQEVERLQPYVDNTLSCEEYGSDRFPI